METTELIKTASKYFRCNKVNVSDEPNFRLTYDIGYFCIQISQEEDGYLGLVLNEYSYNAVYSAKDKNFDSVCQGIFEYLKDIRVAISKALTTPFVNSAMSLDGRIDY